MKTKFFILALALIIPGSAIFSQSNFSSYYNQNRFGLTSPDAMKYGLYGRVNPALLTYVDQPDFYFAWSDRTGNWYDFNNWGVFAAVPNLSFSAVTEKFKGLVITDYKLSAAIGDRTFSAGLGYGFSAGDDKAFNRSSLFTAGLLFRPFQYLSVGLVGNFPTKLESEAAVDVALRPFGNEWLSVFGDYVYREKESPADIKWSAGASIEALPGVRITGRYYDKDFFNVGAELSFGRFGINTNTHYDADKNHTYNTYGIRIGAYDRNIFKSLFENNNYIKYNLAGPVKYQKYKLFDNSTTLLTLLRSIDAAAADPSINGIAINLSGININKETGWELRERLKQFQYLGKKVVIYIDRPGMDEYHLASVADKIVLDPQGMIMLPGYLMGRSFYKGTLEKLGVGFSELRYFKYKSAVESFSRDSMSTADKEQRQALVDDYYKLAKSDICATRNISYNDFDNLVNEKVVFLPQDALSNKLVDTVGRWDAVGEMVKALEGEYRNYVSPGSLEQFNLPEDNYWGEVPEVAVIYAIGSCAMDDGITARKLVNDVDYAVSNNNIKAIVLRVDSPGGDALASDLIAEALRKAKGKKPVIVSQGYVAASGGYWLSMYGDTIVAAPNTITGSIGVISGWYYNKSLKEYLGISTDFVKAGIHADLGFGFTLPYIPVALPNKDLNEMEKEVFKKSILTMYREFVSKVADGRKIKFDEIGKIAQGRVWSGYAGLNNGLVDKLGGLADAIEIAVSKAGLTDCKFNIVELPEPPLFNFNIFIPKIFGFEIEDNE
ncbi:MAG: signal peptide peptidase SppA, partial [Ignavibacteriaceae bacterium]|nr:signal peptide peptidase SppA [Ignavibacteriaceae bacterium]